MDEHFHISLIHSCVCWCGQQSHLFIMLWQCLVSCIWPAWGQWERRRGEQVWGRQAGGCADGLSQRMLLPANVGFTHTHNAYRSADPHLEPPRTVFAFNQGTITACAAAWSVQMSCWQEQWPKTLMRWWPDHRGVWDEMVFASILWVRDYQYPHRSAKRNKEKFRKAELCY